MVKRYTVGRAAVSAVNLSVVLDICQQLAARGPLGYICLTTATQMHKAQQDESLNKLLSDSFLTLCSSKTIALTGQRQGFRHCGAVDPVMLMHSLFLTSAMQGQSHYFYGADAKQMRQLKDYVKNSYMAIRIAGTTVISGDSTTEDIKTLAKTLNELKPAFFWCGLPSPQQESLLASLQPQLTHTSCIGVGSAFQALAEAGIVLPDPGKRTLPGKSRFLALRRSVTTDKLPVPVMLWLLKLRLKTLFSGKTKGRERRKHSSRANSRNSGSGSSRSRTLSRKPKR
ncbi:UDP-N-acetyl-D-mannosaminuronic acid transferase, WecB/TagA/CpsF family [Cyclonatronum proteinivorum]|uniref:UDP-N-acetyl-D-mannosaminuronic acid transferase, WecB/TagA/CpsF family n=1 Tax=Cyclonatronum proteinivorum TaxID=1457365 RepID=A0A345UMN9_9BACT|nr:WecB/TagA/CpsF family glycosyltransferase [Cyclonatronum proteinivorum]AXJ01741.1 UDP-N-acetyl-D-mannosaminuronic acid transferase, WecB/TagA/CpsF family [Cyclonatronum proteinivorum]